MTSSHDKFEHFEVARRPDGTLHELGRGAMGVTYKAFDTRLGSYVALKVINADAIRSEVGRVRFEREAKAAAHLNHPNVASIFHRGQGGGTYFYAMQFIEGETFDAFVKRRGPLPVELALRLILQAAQGLAAASTRGLIHRDIKPANLMLIHPADDAEDDDELLVKVIDFGLAKYLNQPGEDNGVSLTGDRIVGTPYYMSPEQIEPEGKDIDARADIYSLGVTLWHLLVGKPPYRGSEMQVFMQHLGKPLPWEQLPASVPAPVHDLLERMMAKEPASRPASHRELVGLIKQQLRMLTGGAGVATGQPPTQEVVEQSTGLPLPPADFSMADVLGRRGKLTTGEVLGLLSLLAPVVDAKREQEGQGYDLTPARIFVRFDHPPTAGADLLAQGMDTWPSSQLEIAAASSADPAAPGGHPARPLGALAYELLSGRAPDADPAPVPGVNTRGNAVLRQVLDATDAFGSAVRFAEAFRLSLAGELHVPEAPVQEVASASAVGWDSGTREMPLNHSLLPTPIRQARRFSVGGAMVFVLLLALAAGGWYAVRRPGTILPVLSTPAALPAPPPATPTVQVGNPAEMGVLPPGTIITRAVRKYTPPPYFPPAAKAAGQQGTTLLEVDVDATGNVTGSTIKKSSGFPLLDEAATQTVRVWRFDPARRNEVAVPSKTLQPIEFKAPPLGGGPAEAAR